MQIACRYARILLTLDSMNPGEPHQAGGMGGAMKGHAQMRLRVAKISTAMSLPSNALYQLAIYVAGRP